MMSTVLSNILSHNKNTEIGKKWSFNSIKMIEDYRSNVPLTNYEDYRPYIERMVEKGEENLISPDKVIYYSPTSGTTSSSKLFPKFVAPGRSGYTSEQTLLLMSRHQDRSTPLGVPIIPGSNADVGALIEQNPLHFLAPPEAYQIADFKSAVYIQMVFGLKTSSVKCILAGFCPTVLTAFNLLAQEWEQMIEDIRNGTLKSSLDLTESQKIALNKAMGDGDFKRADELNIVLSNSAKCDGGRFKSVAQQLWPNLSLISAIAGGSFATYVPKLQHYLGDKIHIGSHLYVATEGMFGVNKWPHSRVSAYSLMTSQIFFEFIPLANADSSQPITLLAEEIKVGEVYEIVVTTSRGLYRYRMGDLIKVLEEGSASEPPVIDVLGRKNLVLNICGEKVTEYQLTAAITAAIGPDGPWNQYLLQGYILTANTKSIPPTHQLWIEFSPREDTSVIDMQTTIAEGAAYIDKTLAEMNTPYGDSRVRNMIGPLMVSTVNAGTFVTVVNTLKQKSHVSENQLKVPHITANTHLIDVLERAKVEAHH